MTWITNDEIEQFRLNLSNRSIACGAGVFFKARDHKFAAILTWEKWVGRGWGKMDENTCP